MYDDENDNTASKDHNEIQFVKEDDAVQGVAKVGRRYELQRKIDEELRKLQRTDEMEQMSEHNVNGKDYSSSEVNDCLNDSPITKENGLKAQHAVINEYKLDGDVEVPVNQNSFMEDLSGEEPTQSLGRNEIDMMADSKPGDLQNMKPNEMQHMDCTLELKDDGKSNTTDAIPSDAEFDSAVHSPSMTSPTTTTGTFTLPLQSPDLERDTSDEMLPLDETITQTGREQQESSPPSGDIVVQSSEIIHEASTPSEEIKVVVEDLVAQTEDDTVGQTSEIVHPDLDGDMGDLCETENMSAESENDEAVVEAMETAGSDGIVKSYDEKAENYSDASDGNNSYPTDLEAESAALGAGGEEDEAKELLNTNDPKMGTVEEIKQNDPESTQEVVRNEIGLEKLEGDQKSSEESLIFKDSHAEGDSEKEFSNSDRKISTDDEEYSGFDIDIGAGGSYQEDVSIEEGESMSGDDSVTEEYQVTPACDTEDVPLFADVRYTVGEQITYSEDLADDDKTPTEEKEIPEYPQTVPWDSDGLTRLVDSSTPVQDMSFPSDKADTTSSSGSRDECLSEPSEEFDEETSAKIAEETVSSAIKAAFDICSKSIDSEEGVTADRKENTPTGENTVTHIKAEEVVVGDSCSSNTLTQIEVKELDNIASHSNQTRENDITQSYGETSEKKIAANETMSTDQANRIEETEHCLAVGESNDKPLEEPPVAKVSDENIAEEARNELEPDIPAASNSEVETEYNENPPEAENCEIIEQGENSGAPVDKSGDLSEKSSTETEGDMVKVQESSGHTRNLPDRITYNPALSQRNTEATKWFGQSTSEDKISMKTSGKVDENAEIERKKLIKAMTRKHNPHLVPKWQPPKEKDFTEDLDHKQKESLKKYEERRRSRSDAASTVTSSQIPAMAPVEDSETPAQTSEDSQLPRENIVIESVVHSRDAIGVWESRLTEKQRKEDLERQRLAVGKQKKTRERTSSDIGRARHDSSSSVSSTASGVLPTSENIERESMNVSKVRNRWKNIEEESSKPKPEPVVKSGRRSNFTVNTAPTFRSYQSPAPAISRPAKAVPTNTNLIGPTPVKSVGEKESFIDREIREAAEREERWKQEQWDKMSEVSAASSEEVFPDNNFSDKKLVATVYTRSLPTEDVIGLDIIKDADREELWKEERKSERDSGRHISKDSSGIGSDIISPTPHRHRNGQADLDTESVSSYGSTGIASPPSYVNPPGETSRSGIQSTETQRTSENQSGLDAKMLSTSDAQKHQNAPKDEEEARVRRQRIASLSNAVTPKGWGPSKGLGAVSSVTAVHRSVPKPEVKSQRRPEADVVNKTPITQQSTAVVSSSTSSVAPVAEKEQHTPSPKIEEATPSKPVTSPVVSTLSSGSPGPKKGGPIFQKKSGGPVEISSSKSKLHSLMEKEMADAAAREEEWRLKQLEVVKQGFDVSAQPIVHSTREIRTPTDTPVSPPVNSGDQDQVKLRRPVKSLFADDEDESPSLISDDGSDEYKKRAVVKAMRMPKRKSQLAMKWEEGQFQNSVPDEKA